jgi:hypothetical protein
LLLLSDDLLLLLSRDFTLLELVANQCATSGSDCATDGSPSSWVAHCCPNDRTSGCTKACAN